MINYQAFTDYLTNRAKGAAYPAVDTEIISNAEIPLPPLSTQQKIASVLSAYDNLIENNTRRIQILEEMAQRIYKEWFVDFKYPGHEDDELVDSELGMIPEGWKIIKLNTIADVNPESVNNLSILNGPLFLKKGLVINKFNTKTCIKCLSRFIANYFLSTIDADHCASAIFFPSTKASPLYFQTRP